ncbi:MAG TPA: hypothetical protein VJU61_17490 [Polyangiaceae bacterium]|nr:hypothetical protein [Polyangiaceae bacterium]
MKAGTPGRERSRLRSQALLGLLCLASCGRWGYTWVSPFDDGAVIPRDSLGVDAGDLERDGGPGVPPPGTADAGGAPGEPVRCAQFGLFGTPELLRGVGQTLPFSPALSADGLLLVFGAGAPGDLFLASRTSAGSLEFSAATALREVNTAATEVTPSWSADALTLFFATDRQGVLPPRDLMQATRTDRDADFGAPSLLLELNSLWTENLPHQSQDGREFFFTSDRPGGLLGMDIWRAQRDDVGQSFSNVAPVSELNSSFDDSGAALSADALHIVFTSERTGGPGGRDLWSSQRSDRRSPFAAPSNVVELNSGGDDADAALSSDGTELIFASDRAGTRELWRALRSCVTPAF